MTDRVKALTVVLERDIRVDDVKELTNAILMFRGVADVQPLISDPVDYIAKERARHELEAKILDVLKR